MFPLDEGLCELSLAAFCQSRTCRIESQSLPNSGWMVFHFVEYFLSRLLDVCMRQWSTYLRHAGKIGSAAAWEGPQIGVVPI